MSHSEEEGEEDHDDEQEEESDTEGQESMQTFVAWLGETPENSKGPSLRVGELHFSNAEHTDSPDDPRSYCIVYEMICVEAPGQTEETEDEDPESEEPPFLFSFTGFPFRVLPASSCVAVPLVPMPPTSQGGPSDTYAMDAEFYESLLYDLHTSDTYARVSTNWRLPTPAADKVINGLNAWWAAGENKSGWNPQNIPQTDLTTDQNINGYGSASSSNVLLQLYGDLCAFKPLKLNASFDIIEERCEWRTCLCTYLAWAVPNDDALHCMQQVGPILEIGAGTGYWAWLLAQRGVDIVAYDAVDSHQGHKHRFRHSLVRDGGVEQAGADEHKGRALFLCWPDIVGDSAADDADRGTFGVDCLKAYKGDTVIYVGEIGPDVVHAKEGWSDPFPPGGSSSSAAFQNELHLSFRLKQRVQLPNWPPYNSHLTVWVREKEAKKGVKRKAN